MQMAGDQIELQNMCCFQALGTNDICTKICFQKKYGNLLSALNLNEADFKGRNN